MAHCVGTPTDLLLAVTLSCTTLLTAGARADSASTPSSVPTELCAGRAGCEVQKVTWAGRNARWEELRVIALKLPFRDSKACDQLAECNCQPYEYWRLVGAAGAQRAQKVLAVCTDRDAGALRDQDLEIGANRLTFHGRGSAVWSWERSVLMQLDPPRLMNESWSGWSAYSPHNRESTEWSWRTFSGRTKWTIPECTASGEAPEGEPERVRSFAYVPVPRVAVPTAFLWEGWRTSTMERCSAQASADGANGFVLSGAQSTRNDAAVFALATPRALYVEVLDDHLTDADQLKVWLTDAPGTYADHCYAEAPAVRSWTIRMRDGAVLSRSSDLMRVEFVHLNGRTRLKLGMQIADTAGLAVGYADSDEGKTTEREIATAALSGGATGAVGRQIMPEGDHARCVLVRSALVPKLTPSRGTTDPLIGDQAAWLGRDRP